MIFQFPVTDKGINKLSRDTQRKVLVHVSLSATADTVLLTVRVSRHTYIDAVEVDTPVGSGPGGNEAIAMLARRGQGGAGGRQSSHRLYSFLHSTEEERAFSNCKALESDLGNDNRPGR